MEHPRDFIGNGIEHNVYAAHTNPSLLLKKPRPLTIFVLSFTGGIDSVKQQLAETEELVKGKDGVRVANTRIIPFGRRGYVMAQEKIHEDGSIPDIRQRFEEQGLPEFADRHPRNFVSQDGIVYLIDPTQSPATRVLSRLGITPETPGVKLLRPIRKLLQIKIGKK